MSILTNLWKILKSYVTSIIVSYFQSIARGPTGVTVALHVVLDSNLEQLQRRPKQHTAGRTPMNGTQ